MRLAKPFAVLAVAFTCATSASALAPERASAISFGPVCTVAGVFSGLAGKACSAVQNGGRLFGAGKKLLSGHLGGAAKALLGTAGKKAGAVLGLAAVGAWVLGGAKAAMIEAAKLVNHSTSPQLTSSWFSASYWRMAGIAAVLTLPFLFVAAIQAIVHSDLALLARAALGYLPLSVLAVSIAAPVTMLLLAASDQMSAIVSSAAGGDGVKALVNAGWKIGALTAIDHSPFLAFFVGLFIAAGAFALWLELLMREAAVYVVVLMLPLAFAALVWPARRVWAIRAVELLVALILSKFAIVAVLSLAAAALGHSYFTADSAMLAGLVLVILAAFAPWVVVRMLPMAEIASGAAGSLKGEMSPARERLQIAAGRADQAALMLGPAEDGGMTPEEHSRETARTQTQRAAEMQAVSPSGGARKAGDDGPGFGGSGAPLVPPEPSGPTGSGGPGQSGPDAGGPGASGPLPEAPDAPPGPGSAAGASGAERIPGLPEVFQRDDMTWRPLTLGLDDGWPPPPLEPDKPGSQHPPRPGGANGAEELPGDDHNPLAPEQESEDGPL